LANPKVFEFAKEVGLTPLALMDKIREWSLPVKSHMAELDPDTLAQIKIKLSGGSGATEEVKLKKTAVKKVVAKASPKKPEAPTTVASAKTTAEASAAAALAASGKGPVVRRKTKDGDEIKPPEPGKARIIKKMDATPVAVQPEETLPIVRTKSDVQIAMEAGAPTIIKGNTNSPQTNMAVQPMTPPPVMVPPIKQSPPVAAVQSPAQPIVAAVHTASTATVAESVPAEASPEVPREKVEFKPENRIARKKEVVVGTSGVSSLQDPVSGGVKRNIIGRMDLSRVPQSNMQQRPQQGGGYQPRPSGGQSGGYQRPGTNGTSPTGTGYSTPRRPPMGTGFAPRPGNQGIRTGFVAQPPQDLFPPGGPESEEDNRKKDLEKKAKKLSAGGLVAPAPKEGEVVNFNAVEFRKKELVFQPRKKKDTLDRPAMKTQITKPKASKRVVKVYGTMKVTDLADEMGLKVPQLTKALMAQGVSATINTALDFDTIAIIVTEFGWEAQNVQRSDKDLVEEFAWGDLTAESIVRPPVVTVMGHVDHGKTSLLDAIRKTDVAAGEAGGITQHIGAYSVKLEDGSLITFLDTPGHEAFTAMRARGANVTDIAVIVVAADDGMMPQTAEAVNHAKAAGVPMIVAVNKIDKPGANVERIKQQLTEFEIVPEEWGGTTIFCEVSAIKKTGIKELLEQIKLVAEVQEIKANPLRSGTGTVVEAKIEKGKGPVATILVKNGTVKIGQHIVAGVFRGKIKSLVNDTGERVTEVGPGLPVEVLGLTDAPKAGDRFDVVKDEVQAERLVQVRLEQIRASEAVGQKLSLEQIFAKATRGDVKELSIVLKADVQGSLEAVTGMLRKLENPLVKTKVIHTAVGAINESDVLLAHTAKGIVLGFGVRPDTGAAAHAKRLGIDVRTYCIVYELIDDMKKALSGMLQPDIVERVMGRVEVRNTFTVPKIGTIAGCFVIDGKVNRAAMARLLRDGKIIYEGKISSLKRFKDDAKEVATGFECGIGIENFNDVKVGDAIEVFVKEEKAKEIEFNAQV
jgi:translation initiation factor IF-2